MGNCRYVYHYFTTSLFYYYVSLQMYLDSFNLTLLSSIFFFGATRYYALSTLMSLFTFGVNYVRTNICGGTHACLCLYSYKCFPIPDLVKYSVCVCVCVCVCVHVCERVLQCVVLYVVDEEQGKSHDCVKCLSMYIHMCTCMWPLYLSIGRYYVFVDYLWWVG